MKKYVFKGPSKRVQLTILGPLRKVAYGTNYMVYALPINANPNRAFSTGEPLYFGNSFRNAWSRVAALCDAKMPPSLVYYHWRATDAKRV